MPFCLSTSLDSCLNSTLSLCYFQPKFIHPISILPLFPPISHFCLAQSHHSSPLLVYSGTLTMPFSEMCGNHVRYYGNTTYNFNTFSHPLYQFPPFTNAYISPLSFIYLSISILKSHVSYHSRPNSSATSILNSLVAVLE